MINSLNRLYVNRSFNCLFSGHLISPIRCASTGRFWTNQSYNGKNFILKKIIAFGKEHKNKFYCIALFKFSLLMYPVYLQIDSRIQKKSDQLKEISRKKEEIKKLHEKLDSFSKEQKTIFRCVLNASEIILSLREAEGLLFSERPDKTKLEDQLSEIEMAFANFIKESSHLKMIQAGDFPQEIESIFLERVEKGISAAETSLKKAKEKLVQYGESQSNEMLLEFELSMLNVKRDLSNCLLWFCKDLCPDFYSIWNCL